jgi:hypothetical protein
MHTRSSDAEDCIQAERSQDQQGGFGKELELVGSRVESDAGRGQRPVHQTTAWKASFAMGKKPTSPRSTPSYALAGRLSAEWAPTPTCIPTER